MSLFEGDVEAGALAEVEASICRWAGRITAATCGWLMLLAVFDRREGWSGLGMRSCAHWLSWRCGIGLRTARQYLATAHALEQLPAIRAAFAAGTLSYAKVRAVTRVAEASTEQVWLTHARYCTAGQLERLVRTYRQVTGDRTGRRAARRVSWRCDDDGMLHLTAVLPPEDGARLVAALDAARASLTTTTPPNPSDPSGPSGPSGDVEAGGMPTDGETVTVPRDRQGDADALMALADGFLNRPAPGLMTPTHTLTVHLGTTTLAPSTGTTATTSTTATAATGTNAGVGAGGEVDRSEQTTVDGHSPAPAEAAEETRNNSPARRAGLPRLGVGAWAQTAAGIGLPPPEVDRLGCDGLIRVLLTDLHGNPLHLGRRRRLPTRRLREAIHTRDQGVCRYPGCDHTHWLQIHHLDRWTDGGDTDVDRLLLLCSAHHHTVHDTNIQLTRTPDGTVHARTPDGRMKRSRSRRQST